MDFGILGPLQVVHAGEPPPLGGVQRRALLALLLIAAPETVSRDRIVDELWGERPPTSAAHAIEVHISGIRKLLRTAGAADLLRTSGHGYLLDVDPERVDAARFERLIREAQSQSEGDPERAARLFDEALALWRGAPLRELEDYEFARLEAERLLELRALAREGLVEARLAAGESSELLATLADLVSENPLRERPRRLLMLALYRCGRHAEALDVYRQAAAALDEIGLEPGPELRALEQRILNHDPALAPAAVAAAGAAAPTHPTNVEASDSALVGREAELDQLRRLLGGETHLVTLTGRGGTGKTRLALAAGVDLLDMFPGGTWFVPLADVEGAEHLLAAVAGRLGTAETREGSLLAAIAEQLQGAPTLLILDNLEQLHDAAATVDELLSAAPNTRVLATSQIPLRLTREHVLALGPLPGESGVRLFLERAARHGARAASDGSLAAVDAICERLDGLPLAIELAAARTVALTPDELLQRLDESLGILSSRERDRPTRQRSLRATVEWSVSLLEPDDAELFATLCLFAGTFTLADAAALAGRDVLDALEALVQSSFVRRIVTEDDAATFTIAQALREFGREQLVADGRLDAARTAHARWVLARSEAGWEALLADARDPAALTIGLADDVRLALEFLRPREPVLHLQLVGAYTATTSTGADSVWLAADLEHAIAANTGGSPLLARAHLQAGEIALGRGQTEASLTHLGQARELALDHGPPIVAVMALLSMSRQLMTDDPGGARRMAEQALAESDAAGGRQWAVIELAVIDVAQGRVEVEALLTELLTTVTNVEQLNSIRHLFADCALLRGDGHATIERYASALRERSAIGRRFNPYDLDGLAMGLSIIGRPEHALEVDAIAEAARREYGLNMVAGFWERLRDRHLVPLRAAAASPPDPAAVTDLVAALDRALALADAALCAASASASAAAAG